MQVVLVIAILLVLSTIGVGIYAVKCEMKGIKVKRILGINLSTFFLLLVASAMILFSGSTSNAQEATDAAASAASNAEGLRFIGAALSTGLAAIGAGIAVAASGAAAIGAISENDRLLGKTVIFVGLAEGIAIYGLIISIMILGA